MHPLDRPPRGSDLEPDIRHEDKGRARTGYSARVAARQRTTSFPQLSRRTQPFCARARAIARAVLRTRRDGLHRRRGHAHASRHAGRRVSSGRGPSLSGRFVPVELRAASGQSGARFGGKGGSLALRLSAREGLAAARSARLRAAWIKRSPAAWRGTPSMPSMLGQFDCEQRVATVPVELALRTGMQRPSGGVAFDIPSPATDAAYYLGLNPDTLSRVMSRLRAQGHLQPQRAGARSCCATSRACRALSGRAVACRDPWDNASARPRRAETPR